MTVIEKVNELHNQAMEIADLAILARRQNLSAKAQTLFAQAFEYELAAAHLVAATEIEPTRSVLHRSAATLALDCGEVRIAEKLIATALAGDPPPEIARELRDLLPQVWEQMPLSLA
jgi:hypothetical protein